MTRFILKATIVAGAVVGIACGGGKGDAKPSATAAVTGTTTASATAAASPTEAAKATAAPASGSNKFDPGKADAIAHASMVSATDLPGGGWAVSKKDDFTATTDSTTASCAPMNVAQKAFRTALDVNRAGRAEVELSKTAAAALLPSSAEFLVYIYQDTKAAAAPLAAYRSMVDAATFMKCLEDEMVSDASMTAKVTKVSPAASVPDNGVAVAFEVAITAGSITFTMRVETYAWQTSNAFVGVNLAGPKDVVTADLSKTAVSKLQAALDAAAGAR